MALVLGIICGLAVGVAFGVWLRKKLTNNHK